MKPSERMRDDEQADDGRWRDAQRTPPPRRHEPMALREVRTRLVTRDQLEQGYEGPNGVRREFKVVAYVVEDPAGAG